MQRILPALVCGLLLSIPLSSAYARAIHVVEVGHPASVSRGLARSGDVTLAAAPTPVDPSTCLPDAKKTGPLHQGAKCPHLSDETPLRQALAPQKSQAPDGTSVGLDEQEQTNADPLPR
jgi:hypothetical protein